MKKILLTLIVLILLVPSFLSAQDRNFWQKTSTSGVNQEDIIDYTTKVNEPLYFGLDKIGITEYAQQSPDRFLSSSSSVLIDLPNPAGEMETFRIFSTETMSRELAEKHSQITSYTGYNLAKKSHSVRITITPYGFYAMTLGSVYGQTFINPYAINSNIYMVFGKSQIIETEHLDCHSNEHYHSNDFLPSDNFEELVPFFIEDGELRKYRLAVATTVEYSDFHWQAAGLNISDSDEDKRNAVQAAIVVAVDRVNQMFERDFGVTLELVANNDELIFLGDPNDDPYTNNDHGQMILENQTVLDNEIGSANYDVGHVLNTNGGGLAYTPAVCADWKAGGSTGSNSPIGDPFVIDILSHEIGHQFGANHTQNNNTNRNDATAVETGSGTTIMGYAGVSVPNVQNNSDAMFHYISISEVENRFSGFFGSCAEIISIANDPPIIEPISNYTIPQNTPFVLNATATDSNYDELTYSWEQIDNEIAVMPPLATSSAGPAFRTRLPTTQSMRYFPSMGTLLENSYENTWEVLSTVNRDYNFAVVIRDNNPLGGQVATETTTVTVDATAGPFRVTSQDDLEDPWLTNDTKTITWDVAGTNDPSGINAQNVDILLSIDNGETFSVVLAENTPNDGEEEIIVPDVSSSNARIMVMASDNIFFDINEQSFSINEAFIPEYCEAGSDNQGFTNISRVEFNTIDNTSGNDGYSDFTSIYTSVQRGESYNLEVHSQGGILYTGDQVIVWIDFNKNGSFDDPGEKVIETTSFAGDWSIYPFGGTIEIPTDALLGETTMRIRINNSNFGTSNSTPCGNSTYGEVEDYRIVIYDDFVYYEEAWEPQSPSGISTDEDNILVVNGETTLSETTQVKDLTVQIGSKLNILGTLDVEGDITNTGDLIFLSNDENTGQLASFSGTISRPIEVQRYIPSKRTFRFLSTSVSGSTIADSWQEQIHITGVGGASNGFDNTASNVASMFTYDHSQEIQNQPWTPVASTSEVLEAGKPYRVLVRGDRELVDLSNNSSPSSEVTLSSKGTMHTGNFSVQTSNYAENFSFVGNPYQSIVNLDQLAYGDGVNRNFAYYWEPSLGDFGGFVTLTIPTVVPDPSSTNADHFLRPGQAVFMRNNDTGSNYSITFNENSKEPTGNQLQVFGSTNLDYMNLRVYKTEKYNANLSEEDAIGFRFSENYTNQISHNDAVKIGNAGLNFAAVKGNNLFSIQSRELPQNDEVIPLFINNIENGNYLFWVNLQETNLNSKVFLRDKYEDSMTEVSGGINEIHFTKDLSVPESVHPLRFELVFEDVSLSNPEFESLVYQLYPNPTPDGIFTLQSKAFANQQLELEIYNILGQKVFSTKQTASDSGILNINASSLLSATYILKIINNEKETITDKLIVK